MSILGVLVVIGIVLVAKSESVVLDSRTSIRTTSIEGNNESHPRPIATDFTDERVIPVSATDKLKLLLTKSTVSDKTFQDWLTKGETATNTFKLFRLTDAGENLFDNPQFRKWINYVDELNKWSRDKAESPIATLALQYDDSALFNMFSVAKTNPSTEDLAVTLQRQLLEYWVTNGKSPDDVFKVVGLYAAGKKVLEHPHLGAWIEYTKLFNNQYHHKQTTLLETMKRSHGNENLQKFLSSLTRVDRTASNPTEKTIEQIEFWVKSGLSTDDVFQLYRLDKMGDRLFDSPSFTTWLLYMNEFNKQNPDKKVTLIATLATHYGDEGMANLLEAAKKVSTTKAMATKLQSEQMKYWLLKMESPESVFRWLKLDKMGDNFFSSLQYGVWRKYHLDYNIKYPTWGHEKAIRAVRSAYDDDVLVRMIVAGKKNPRTQAAAQQMEIELFEAWHGFSPDKVFNWLNKNRKGFDRPMIDYWLKYLKEYQKARPFSKPTMLSIMRRAYEDKDWELASMLVQAEKSSSATEIVKGLQTAQLQRWLDRDISPEYLFRMLQLDGKQGGILNNSLLPVWMKFLDAFNIKNPTKKTTLFDTLKKFFSDDQLEKIFIAAQRNPSTNKMGADLFRALHGQ